VSRILDFIRAQMQDAGKSRLVVGLSGGLDSAVSAYLAARALGSESLTAFLMPYKTTDRQSTNDALLVASELGIAHKIMTSRPLWTRISTAVRGRPQAPRQFHGAHAYGRALRPVAARDALVLGTGNRTEALLGYTTLWGYGLRLHPIGDLFKTQVREVGRHLGCRSASSTNRPARTSGRARPTRGDGPDLRGSRSAAPGHGGAGPRRR